MSAIKQMIAEAGPYDNDDACIAARFHEAFTTPLSSSKRAAMRELGRNGRGATAAARLF